MLFTADGFPYFEPNDSASIFGQSQTVANFCQPFIGNWKAPRQARVIAKSAAMSVPTDAAWHPVTSYDLGTPYNVSNITFSGGILTIGKAGLYLLSATVVWPPVTTGPVRLFAAFYTATGGGALGPDALNRGRGDLVSSSAVPYSQVQTYNAQIPFAAGDQVQLWLYVDAPAASISVSPTSLTAAALA